MGLGTALRSGEAWSKGVVTWGDPRWGSAYGASYRSDVDGDGASAQNDGFTALTSTQVAAVRLALDTGGDGPAGRAGFAVEGFTGLSVRYAAGSSATDLRFANARDCGTAYAYQPGAGNGGDVWFGGSGARPLVGNYDHSTVLHETGHALGLDHPHESGQHGAVPRAWDSPEFTVMTYRAWEGADPVGYRFETWGAPQTYMMLDIAALQEIYGANYRVNAGDTVYSWKPESGRTFVNGAVGLAPGGTVIFATIWDGGGRDGYDLSAYRADLAVDLRPGGHSVFAKAQLADLGGGPNGGHARGSIFNALLHDGDRRSLIEDARGGAGDDRIAGNAAGNRLSGGAGDDTLTGFAGRDGLVGGSGDDRFCFRRVGDSPAGAGDRLMRGEGATAFEGAGRPGGDRIDLHAIDADMTRRGDQAFVLGGDGPSRLWLVDADGVTLVRGSIDRDAAPELEIRICDGAIGADDYRASDFLF